MKVTETVAGDGGTLDRISELPESLLVRIISLLPTTEDAFRTSLVSKRWQYLWTCIDTLNFTFLKKSEAAENNFIHFVNYTFSQLNSSKISKLHLGLSDIPTDILPIEQWLTYALKYNVEHLVLKSKHGGMYTLPQLFYTCSSFISLHLYRCTFDKGAVISWKSLKNVSFTRVDLDDEAIVKLLSGCPLLETMDLWFCNTFSHLEINNSNLKTLKLRDLSSGVTGNRSLEIFAPYLQHLEISGDAYHFKCRLQNVSSLVSAELTFQIMCFAHMVPSAEVDFCRDYHRGFWSLVQDYLQKLSHVKELTIGTWFAEVLFMLQLDGVQLPEMKCKCLTLKFPINKYNFYGVASLLRSSPHVETLSIDMDGIVYRNRCLYESSYFRKGDNIDLKNWIANYAFPSLKSVNIMCSRGICLKESYNYKVFELSELLLKNAMVLEKFVIVPKSRKCCQCSKKCAYPYLSQLAANLSGCPRPSTNFMIVFRKSDFND